MYQCAKCGSVISSYDGTPMLLCSAVNEAEIMQLEKTGIGVFSSSGEERLLFVVRVSGSKTIAAPSAGAELLGIESLRINYYGKMNTVHLISGSANLSFCRWLSGPFVPATIRQSISIIVFAFGK